MPEIVADNISIIETKELERFSRVDAEYYQPKYLALQQLYSKGFWSPIGQHLNACEYGLSIAMNEDGNGYGILRMDNLQGGFAFDDELKYAPIDKKTFEKYRLKKDDVLFNRVNSEEFVGRTGIYKLSGAHVFASYLVKCQTKESELLPDYLNIFLNTKHGILSIRRMSRRAVNQANVNAQELKAIKILLPPIKLQEEIKGTLEKSHQLFEKSETLYSQAERLLLET
ncbi:MAG: restriction endonuclease subunit S, partial [Nitrospirae bacterium]|nr:restriction endonuclease subunit S [Nitrospirota bacterium]